MAAWAKNDHLGFEVFCVHRGVVRKYRPDFLIRLQSGDMLVLETKGRDSEQNRTKRRFLDEWVNAINAHGGFGRWVRDVSRAPGLIFRTFFHGTWATGRRLKAERSPTVWLQNAPFAPTGIGPLPCIPARQTIQ